MKRLFKGGTVVSGDGMKKLDILVKGEKILAVGEDQIGRASCRERV